VLESVEISDDEDDDFNYAAVDEAGFGGGENDDDDEEDLASALASVQLSPEKRDATAGRGSGADANLKSITQVRPSVVDDFIRNFLIKTNLRRSLDCFNTASTHLKGKLFSVSFIVGLSHSSSGMVRTGIKGPAWGGVHQTSP
jgi:hypothetical protein